MAGLYNKNIYFESAHSDVGEFFSSTIEKGTKEMKLSKINGKSILLDFLDFFDIPSGVPTTKYCKGEPIIEDILVLNFKCVIQDSLENQYFRQFMKSAKFYSE